MPYQLIDDRVMNFSARKATEEDCKNIYDWRTFPLNREHSYSYKEFPYTDHKKWFKKYLKNNDNLMLIIEYNDKEICVVRFDGPIEEKMVSIYMVPGYHRKGLGLLCLTIAECYLKEKINSSPCNLYADIKFDNFGSMSLFSKARYVYYVTYWHKIIEGGI